MNKIMLVAHGPRYIKPSFLLTRIAAFDIVWEPSLHLSILLGSIRQEPQLIKVTMSHVGHYLWAHMVMTKIDGGSQSVI